MPESAVQQAELNAVDQYVDLLAIGYAGGVIQLAGTWAGTVSFEATADGLNWVALNGVKSNATTPVSSATSNGAWVFGIAGFIAFRAYTTALASGRVKVTLRADPAAAGGPGGGGGGGGGVVQLSDGVDPAILATVKDYTSSKPVAVVLTAPTTGDPYEASGAPSSGTSTLSNVPENVASVTLLASNANRLGFVIENDTDDILLVKFGTTASATSFTRAIPPRGSLSTDDIGVNYTGRIDGIWLDNTGTVGHDAARITELT
jgi:hypothetical protein